MDFVSPGPGARDGIKKCFVDRAGLNEAEIIRLMADNQEIEFERLGLSFQSLWGRRLQDRKSTRLNSSHYCASRMPSSAGQTHIRYAITHLRFRHRNIISNITQQL